MMQEARGKNESTLRQRKANQFNFVLFSNIQYVRITVLSLFFPRELEMKKTSESAFLKSRASISIPDEIVGSSESPIQENKIK